MRFLRAQIGVELVVMVGFMLVFLLPLIIGFFGRVVEFDQNTAEQQAARSAERIATLANTVGSQGPGARVTAEVVVPKNVIDFRASGREVVFTLATTNGISQVVRISYFEMAESPDGYLNTQRQAGSHMMTISASESGGLVIIGP